MDGVIPDILSKRLDSCRIQIYYLVGLDYSEEEENTSEKLK